MKVEKENGVLREVRICVKKQKYLLLLKETQSIKEKESGYESGLLIIFR
jgi:hypothetical protein